PTAALELAEVAFDLRGTMGVSSEFVKEGFAIACSAALELGNLDRAEGLIAAIETLPPGKYPQLLRAQVARFKARIAMLRGDAAEAERLFRGAIGLLRELAVPFHLAATEHELVELAIAHGRDDDAEPLLAEARGHFT